MEKNGIIRNRAEMKIVFTHPIEENGECIPNDFKACEEIMSNIIKAHGEKVSVNFVLKPYGRIINPSAKSEVDDSDSIEVRSSG